MTRDPQRVALGRDWSLTPQALFERFELGADVERALWQENVYRWEPLSAVLRARYGRGAADVRRWTHRQQLAEAAVLRDVLPLPERHAVDCGCTACEDGWKRLLRDVLPLRRNQLATRGPVIL